MLLWNQVDALQKHFKKDDVHIYAPLDEASVYGMLWVVELEHLHY